MEGYKGIDKGNQYSISKEIEKILSTCPVKHSHSSLYLVVMKNAFHEGCLAINVNAGVQWGPISAK